MYTENELHIAKICVKNKLLTEEQLEECLKEANQLPPQSKMTLGDIMIARNYITPEQLRQSQRAQTYEQSRKYDKLYGEICTQKGFVDEKKVQEGLNEQKQSYILGEAKITRLQDFLLTKNLITRSQHMEVLPEFLKRQKEAAIRVSVQSVSALSEEGIEEPDLTFGKLALKNRMITEKQLAEIFDLYRLALETEHFHSVQSLLEEKNYISTAQSQIILKTINYANWRKMDKIYGHIAVEFELATERQIEEILELQKSRYMSNNPNIVRLLDELTVRGLISSEEADKIITHQRRDDIRTELNTKTGTFPAVSKKKTAPLRPPTTPPSTRIPSNDDTSSSGVLAVPASTSERHSGIQRVKPKTVGLSRRSGITTATPPKITTTPSSKDKDKDKDSEDADKMPCPFCKKKIRLGSKKCKHCGYYIV
jgi:hypothetical protein